MARKPRVQETVFQTAPLSEHQLKQELKNAKVQTVEEVIASVAPERKKPSWSDIASIVGKDAVAPDRNGKIDVNVDIDPATAQGRRNRAALDDCFRPYIRSSAAQALERAATRPHALLRNPRTGETRQVPAELEETAARHAGLVAVARRRATWRTVYHRDGTTTTFDRHGRVVTS